MPGQPSETAVLDFNDDEKQALRLGGRFDGTDVRGPTDDL
jgi:hypothetical protein